ncbi:glycoside hydrolase family 3 protein [Stakelama saccharophila]|uniref:Glycoside hydrolase family 3 N-terminal domain-containing protein n=1 Tax=Stakelama saccharophila TaxID=3075605 RepID=A0ABZ0B7N8_9SPHN|nr:glycoside hydrolase family 3 N-terminal domain-containing protein [Stakelama sp. W311]WNO52359.1 glycoside hydrolase family 3 N-terminal domain-containing protein [Stakelama sp. W311]
MKRHGPMWMTLMGAMIAAAPLAAQQKDVAKAEEAGVAHPDLWPEAQSPGLVDSETEAFITDLMDRMSVREKVGQMIQGDIGSIKPEDLREYPVGSILAGGSSPPLNAPDRSGPKPWLETSRAFNEVALEEREGHVPIPLMFGIDAVHGNSNIVGATLFPHNVGLGAMHDPALIRRIGKATAEETAAAGIDWAFGPTLAVPQDERWGRAYEGYSEDPDVVRSYAGQMVLGLQGEPGKGTIQNGRVAASAKHFLGDGGTKDGIDQGDADIPESELIRIHNAGYPAAIEAGVKTVMASFSSWQGVKMHGNKSLLTGVLKGRMGFDGFVVGDWNGHGQVEGCTKTNCPVTFNAGLDMAMAADSWKGLFDNTVAQVKSGRIPMARVDDAVRRILRVKAKLGLFNHARPYEGRFRLIGSPEHRAIAREAVRKSLVLLKNDGVLPVKSSADVLVAGPGADDISMQSGGWTLSWQGDGNTREDFPNAQSIYGGIAEAMKAGGGSATLSVDGSFTKKPDLAIVVFGEQPYAEMRGDVRTLEFQPGDKEALALLKKLKGQGIRTVSVFLSGRPLWVNPEINQSDAFVAAWLPGSEGGGVADVLIGTPDGAPRADFTGTLSFSWPKTAGQFTLNKGEPGYDPLFPLGYGLTYGEDGHLPHLGEVAGVDASLANSSLFFAKGKVPAPFAAAAEGVRQQPTDSQDVQEGAIALTWPAGAGGTYRITGPELDLSRETNADILLQMIYRVDTAPTGKVTLAMGDGSIDVTRLLDKSTGGWQTMRVPLKCLRNHGTDIEHVRSPFAITAQGPFAMSLSDLRLATDPAGAACPD